MGDVPLHLSKPRPIHVLSRHLLLLARMESPYGSEKSTLSPGLSPYSLLWRIIRVSPMLSPGVLICLLSILNMTPAGLGSKEVLR